MGTKTLNLNNYEKVSEDEASLKVILFKVGSITPPPLFLKHIDTSDNIDTSCSEWSRDLKISLRLSTKEYRKIVYWWFLNVSEEYRKEIKDRFYPLYKENLEGAIKRAKEKLIKDSGFKNNNGKYTKRTPNINVYLVRYLNQHAPF